jgi:hypothetical protein
MTEAVRYFAVVTFLLSPVLWLLGIIFLPVMVASYLAMLAVNSRSAIPASLKTLNAAVIIATLVAAGSATAWLASCGDKTCGPAALMVLPFVVSAPSIALLALANYRYIKAAIQNEAYVSAIELEEDEGREDITEVFKKIKNKL